MTPYHNKEIDFLFSILACGDGEYYGRYFDFSKKDVIFALRQRGALTG